MDQVDPSNVGLACDFQITFYENLIAELRKAGVFQGDRKAREIPQLLVLKTTVESYTSGNDLCPVRALASST